MRIRYFVPFKRKIIIDDHWEIPMQGGKLRIIEESGYAKAIELTFEKQPLEYAPSFQKRATYEAMTTITGHDELIAFVKRQLDNAAIFLECFHDIELMTEEIEAKYEGETPEEETRLSIKSISMGRHDSALPLSFDMFTRALMAAEKYDGPRFEVAFVKSARKMLENQEFINSFRYSFLLIESLYGNGQFKTPSLQGALKSNQEFRNIVELAIKDMIPAKNDRNSDTAKLISTKPNADDIINHLVEKRGFYFHGNIKRKDAWNPDEQDSAESLALLAIGIITKITMKAAEPMFVAELEKRHFEDAMQVGAKIVFEIKFRFREPEENFDRQHQVNITMPGTKVTPRTAFAVAQHFLHVFQHNQPISALCEAECKIQETGEKVFNLTFHCKEE
ncbi:hypothetical protein SB00001_01191 [Klebsiella variicola]|uniref:hypothetical protein n=1 Tax=Klebsiella TaxID=570 RepID=UPI000D6E429A|nr:MULTISPECIES: hypothetical protein [Klebsiella]UDC24836.1 hypothetical protein LGN95_06310 [Klebsiella variicola subsp. variicola]WRR62251.1 hypothetical protein SPE70_19590 [Klebsiella sp. ZJOU C1]VGO85789.1 hypothetical protein SB00001_01191 [Klebsiella variicola]